MIETTESSLLLQEDKQHILNATQAKYHPETQFDSEDEIKKHQAAFDNFRLFTSEIKTPDTLKNISKGKSETSQEETLENKLNNRPQ